MPQKCSEDSWKVEKNMTEVDLQTSRSEKRGRRCSARAEVTLWLVEKTTGKQAVPLQPMEDHTRADISTAGGCAPREATAHGQPTQELAPGSSCGL